MTVNAIKGSFISCLLKLLVSGNFFEMTTYCNKYTDSPRLVVSRYLLLLAYFITFFKANQQKLSTKVFLTCAVS